MFPSFLLPLVREKSDVLKSWVLEYLFLAHLLLYYLVWFVMWNTAHYWLNLARRETTSSNVLSKVCDDFARTAGAVKISCQYATKLTLFFVVWCNTTEESFAFLFLVLIHLSDGLPFPWRHNLTFTYKMWRHPIHVWGFYTPIRLIWRMEYAFPFFIVTTLVVEAIVLLVLFETQTILRKGHDFSPNKVLSKWSS